MARAPPGRRHVQHHNLIDGGSGAGNPTGLFPGLEVTEDILGRPIRNLPDLGAIEVP